MLLWQFINALDACLFVCCASSPSMFEHRAAAVARAAVAPLKLSKNSWLNRPCEGFLNLAKLFLCFLRDKSNALKLNT